MNELMSPAQVREALKSIDSLKLRGDLRKRGFTRQANAIAQLIREMGSIREDGAGGKCAASRRRHLLDKGYNAGTNLEAAKADLHWKCVNAFNLIGVGV